MEIRKNNILLLNKLSQNNGNQASSHTTNPLTSPMNSLKKDVFLISFKGADGVKFKGAAINLSRKTIDDLDSDLSGKIVGLRVDHNVPINKETKEIDDINRITASIPTIKNLVDRNAKVVIMTHIGDPYKLKKGKMGSKTSTEVVANKLGELLKDKDSKKNIEVIFYSGKNIPGAIKNLKPRQVLYIENLRFKPEETGKDAVKDEATGEYTSVKLPKDRLNEYRKDLAKLFNVYVDDAFGAFHRPHSSIELPVDGPKVAGLLAAKEVEKLGKLILEKPQKPFVSVIGGSKIDSKLGVLNKLVEKSNVLIITGGMANTIQYAQGGKLGASLYEDDPEVIRGTKEFLAKAQKKIAQGNLKLIIPKDVIIDYDGYPTSKEIKEFVEKINEEGKKTEGYKELSYPEDAIKIDQKAKEKQIILDINPQAMLISEVVEEARKKGEELTFPKDTIKIAEKAKEQGIKLELPNVVPSDNVPDGKQALDIGPKTVEEIKTALLNPPKASKSAYGSTPEMPGTIFWNGPAGVFEKENYAGGTNALAKAIAKATKENGTVSVIGGGDTVSAAAKAGVQEEEFSFVSTGGGASLEFIEKDGKLPGIEWLDEK